MKKWTVSRADAARVNRIRTSTDLPPLLAEVMAARGYNTAESLAAFFNGVELSDPFLLAESPHDEVETDGLKENGRDHEADRADDPPRIARLQKGEDIAERDVIRGKNDDDRDGNEDDEEAYIQKLFVDFFLSHVQLCGLAVNHYSPKKEHLSSISRLLTYRHRATGSGKADHSNYVMVSEVEPSP